MSRVPRQMPNKDKLIERISRHSSKVISNNVNQAGQNCQSTASLVDNPTPFLLSLLQQHTFEFKVKKNTKLAYFAWNDITDNETPIFLNNKVTAKGNSIVYCSFFAWQANSADNLLTNSILELKVLVVQRNFFGSTLIADSTSNISCYESVYFLKNEGLQVEKLNGFVTRKTEQQIDVILHFYTKRFWRIKWIRLDGIKIAILIIKLLHVWMKQNLLPQFYCLIIRVLCIRKLRSILMHLQYIFISLEVQLVLHLPWISSPATFFQKLLRSFQSNKSINFWLSVLSFKRHQIGLWRNINHW